MRIIVCVDENGGMLFHKRRQSRDSQVTADILALTKGEKLWMNGYSAGLFEEKGVLVSETFLEQAENGAFCFVENQSLQPYLNQIEEIIRYQWNRKYPADFYCDLDLQRWSMIEQKEFSGTSHEKITRERYIKGEE